MLDVPLMIGFSRGTGLGAGLLGAAIRTFTGGTVNHAFLIYDHPQVGWMTLGANADGISYLTLDSFNRNHRIVRVYTTRGWSLWPSLDALKADIGRKYNLAGLAGMMEVEIAHHWFHDFNVKNPTSQPDRRFCSQWVADLIRYQRPFLSSYPDDTIDPQLEMDTLDRSVNWYAAVETPVPLPETPASPT